MTLAQFHTELRDTPTEQLLWCWFARANPTAFPAPGSYDDFKDEVRRAFPTATNVFVTGTANWRFSLNPRKDFKEFGPESDIDTVIVDSQSFDDCWRAIRLRDRLTFDTRDGNDDYWRAGRNIYCGFVAPVWCLERTEPIRYEFRSKLNAISRKCVHGREVKALFFRNDVEALDYYKRGVMLAKARI